MLYVEFIQSDVPQGSVLRLPVNSTSLTFLQNFIPFYETLIVIECFMLNFMYTSHPISLLHLVFHKYLFWSPSKFDNFGFSLDLVNFLCSYLRDRVLQVEYNGEKLSSIVSTSGVPQGSLLEPLLFVNTNLLMTFSTNYKYRGNDMLLLHVVFHKESVLGPSSFIFLLEALSIDCKDMMGMQLCHFDAPSGVLQGPVWGLLFNILVNDIADALQLLRRK